MWVLRWFGGGIRPQGVGDVRCHYQEEDASLFTHALGLLQLSRSFDRGGLLSFVTFILPLILDGIFHGALPKLFAPNTLAMLQRPDLSFRQIATRKRLDRIAQLALLLR